MRSNASPASGVVSLLHTVLSKTVYSLKGPKTWTRSTKSLDRGQFRALVCPRPAMKVLEDRIPAYFREMRLIRFLWNSEEIRHHKEAISLK